MKASDLLVECLEEAFNAGKPAILILDIDYAENLKLTEHLGNIMTAI